MVYFGFFFGVSEGFLFKQIKPWRSFLNAKEHERASATSWFWFPVDIDNSANSSRGPRATANGGHTFKRLVVAKHEWLGLVLVETASNCSFEKDKKAEKVKS